MTWKEKSGRINMKSCMVSSESVSFVKVGPLLWLLVVCGYKIKIYAQMLALVYISQIVPYFSLFWQFYGWHNTKSKQAQLNQIQPQPWLNSNFSFLHSPIKLYTIIIDRIYWKACHPCSELWPILSVYMVLVVLFCSVFIIKTGSCEPWSRLVVTRCWLTWNVMIYVLSNF